MQHTSIFPFPSLFLGFCLLLLPVLISAELSKAPTCYDEKQKDFSTTYVLDCVDLARKLHAIHHHDFQDAYAPTSYDGTRLPVFVYQRTCQLILSWGQEGFEHRPWPPPDWASWDDIAVVARSVISNCPWRPGKQRTVGFGGAGVAGMHQMIKVEVVGRDVPDKRREDVGKVIDLEDIDVPTDAPVVDFVEDMPLNLTVL